MYIICCYSTESYWYYQCGNPLTLCILYIVILQGAATPNDKLLLLLDILSKQEDGTCLRLINVLRVNYPWISIHLQREFIKEKTLYNKEFNEGLSDVVNKQISPMVLGPEAEIFPLPTSAKESLACVEAVSDLLHQLQTLSYRPLNVDPLQVCNMALCLVLEEKIVQCKKTIEHLQEKITKLKVPSNNIRILKHEISIQKEAVKQLNKQHELKDSALNHLQHQNALLKQKLEALQRSNDSVCSK
jgi:hypothetical protein